MLLDDLFSLSPVDTQTFSTTTAWNAAPISDNQDTDILTTSKLTNATSEVVLSQQWTSASDWSVTQSITRSFESEETGDHKADPAKGDSDHADQIVRAGSTTLTISVINGTLSIVTYTISDSFRYSNSLNWDRGTAGEGTEATDGLPTAFDTETTSTEDDAADVDTGTFSGGFQATAIMSITLETILVTLPDGRSARQYIMAYSSSSTFSSSLSGSSQFSQQTGTLQEFTDPATETLLLEASESSSEEEEEEDLLVEPGGNGSSVNFGGTFNYADNFSKNFSLNLGAVVPDGESFDDAVVTGDGSFDVSDGFTQGGGNSLNIQVQTSSGDPATSDSGHEYVSFHSSSTDSNSTDFTFDIDFDIDSSEPVVNTTTPPPTMLTPDQMLDHDPEPIDPADLDFDFNYSTSGSDGGLSKLIYSSSSTFTTGSSSITTSESLIASGTISFGAGFDFNLTDGITVTAQSSGSGTSKFKSLSVSTFAQPDYPPATGLADYLHYPQLLKEATVTSTGGFSADVTLTLGIFGGGLGVDATYSAHSDSEAQIVNRSDLIYWQTEDGGAVNYREEGYWITTATTVSHFGGNETDGFDASMTESLAIEGDVTSVGTRRNGGATAPPEDQSWTSTETILDGVQLALDIGGMVPGFGEPLDAINAGISLGRGNHGEAALSLAAMVPIAGAAVTASKLAGKAGNAVVKNLDKADEAVGALGSLGDEFGDAVQQLSCFPAGTLVNTESGLRGIETVEVGDRVWAFDLVSGDWSLQPVLRTFVRDYENEAVVVTVGGEAIETTQLHPFWVIDGDDLANRSVREHLVAPPENSQLQGRWVDAVDLQAGDTVFLQGPGPTPIESVQLKPVHYPVYNFAVHELKCYAVGPHSVLVHNSNGLELPKSALDIAQSGGKHAGFLKNYAGKTADELKKGIESLKKQIAEHSDKIADPGKTIPGFGQLDPRQQAALLQRKWPSDIARQQEQLAILEGLLKNLIGG